MAVASDYEVIGSHDTKIVPGDMELFSFTLPQNLRHAHHDSDVVITITFNVVKAKNLKWEVSLNDATESQFFYCGSFVFTWQIFPDASQLHPGVNQLGIMVKPTGRGVLEVQGITLHYRVDI